MRNRKELNRQFSDRFLNGNYSIDDYHGPFFFAEFALHNFQKNYGDHIPDEVVKYYENYVKYIEKMNCEYDYETNGFIKK